MLLVGHQKTSNHPCHPPKTCHGNLQTRKFGSHLSYPQHNPWNPADAESSTQNPKDDQFEPTQEPDHPDMETREPQAKQQKRESPARDLLTQEPMPAASPASPAEPMEIHSDTVTAPERTGTKVTDSSTCSHPRRLTMTLVTSKLHRQQHLTIAPATRQFLSMLLQDSPTPPLQPAPTPTCSQRPRQRCSQRPRQRCSQRTRQRNSQRPRQRCSQRPRHFSRCLRHRSSSAHATR